MNVIVARNGNGSRFVLTERGGLCSDIGALPITWAYDCLDAAYTFTNGIFEQFLEPNMSYPTGCFLKGNPGRLMTHWNLEGGSRNLEVKSICFESGSISLPSNIFHVPLSWFHILLKAHCVYGSLIIHLLNRWVHLKRTRKNLSR